LDVRATHAAMFGQYELLQEIGHGGMAVVHRALLRGMGGFSRQVVIKRILPELATDQHFVKMFVEEARLSALLDHPNIVQIHDFGVIDGSYFLAMEYIEGVPLHSFMRRYARTGIPPEATGYIIQQVCIALEYAHGLTRDGQPLGLVHRDVSPANIMLSAHGAVKLLDFGIAKAVQALDREETRTGTLKGKWSYMAPEQVVGQPVTPRSDIFSVGIVLWEMLTGRRLFKAKTDYLTLSNVVQAKVPTVSDFRPDVPKVFDTICARALARRPKDRYRSAEEMSDQLEDFLVGHGYSAPKLAALVAPLLADRPASSGEEITAQSAPSASESAGGFRVGTHESSNLALRDTSDVDDGQLEPLIRRNWTIPILTGAVFLAAIAVLVLYFAVPRPTEKPASSAAKIPAKARPTEVRLRAVSTPPGALIKVAGEATPRGRTPLVLTVRPAPTRLEASLAGYAPTAQVIRPADDEEVSFVLSPLPPDAVAGVDPEPGPKAATRPKLKAATKLKGKAATKGKAEPKLKGKAEPQLKASTKGKAEPQLKKSKKPLLLPDLKSGDLADPYK
jgi:eukaryotic-like serine/threonine-protein kinase